MWESMSWSDWLGLVASVGMLVTGLVMIAQKSSTAATVMLVTITLVLSIGCFGVALYVDRQWHQQLAEYPITSNLIAGLLGLPAAFLIVNLAADRAFSRTARRRWSSLRQAEAAEAASDARVVLASLRHTYMLDSRGSRVDWQYRWDLDAAQRRIEAIQASLKQGPVILGTETISILMVAASKLSEMFESRPDDAYAAHRLCRRSLPRVEAGSENPDRVIAIREAIDALTDLESLDAPRLGRRAAVELRLLGGSKQSPLHDRIDLSGIDAAIDAAVVSVSLAEKAVKALVAVAPEFTEIGLH